MTVPPEIFALHDKSCAECGSTPDRGMSILFKPTTLDFEHGCILITYFLCDECFTYKYNTAGTKALAEVGRDLASIPIASDCASDSLPKDSPSTSDSLPCTTTSGGTDSTS